MRLPALAALVAPLALTGCSVMTTTATPGSFTGAAISGKAYGGQQPIVGAHIYLMAANTTGYGGPGIAPSTNNASISLLTSATGLNDSVGNYVLTDAAGNFTITSDYTCSTGQQVYLYTLGGNPGAGANSAASLLALLGSCPGGAFPASQTVFINEVTTIAAAYSFAGFASDATHVSSSGTTLAQTGIANAFANATNLVNPTTGAALATTPAGNGTVLTTRLNTLANILASCVNSVGPGSSPCNTLFSNALFSGASGTTPGDTATAAINIAHNPTANVGTLYTIPPPAIAFGNALTAQPNDFTLWITYTGVQGPLGLAIDSTGNVWIANTGSNNVIELSPTGTVLSGANGYTGGGLNAPWDVAVDPAGNVWLANFGNNSVTELTSAGAPLSGTAGYTGGGLAQPFKIAIDGTGAAWVTNYAYTSGASYSTGSVTKFSSAGVALAQGNGLDPVGANASYYDTAIDGAGDPWSVKATHTSPSKDTQQLSPAGAPLNAYASAEPQSSSPKAIAIDGKGNVWIANGTFSVVGTVTEISHTGATQLSTGYGAYAESAGLDDPVKIAIDGGGNAWVASYYNSINEISPSGSILTGGQLGIELPTSPQNGEPGGGGAFAIDGSGNLWSATSASAGKIYQIIGAATPVITPIAAGLPLIPTTDGSSHLGTRP